jgi:hypothetical protein
MPFGMKSGAPQTTITKPYLTPGQQGLLDSAQGSVSPTAPGMTGGETSAQNYWTNLVQQAGLAGRGLTGDQSAFTSFAAPGLEALSPMFDRMRAQARSNAGLASTSPFGIGARSGIELATSQQGINEQQAGLTYQNATDALNRMLSMQNFGMGAAGALNQQGMFNRMLPLEWQQGRLGLLGPTGTQTSTPTQSNWLSTLMGIGSLIAAPFTGGASAMAAPGLLSEGQAQPAPTAPGPSGNWDPSSFGFGMGGAPGFGGGAAWDPSSFAYGF